MDLTSDILKVSISEKQIEEMINRISQQINNDFKDKEPLFIGLLKGSIPFMTDLLKKINVKCSIDYISVSTYSGTKSTGKIRIKSELPDVKGKDIIVVEDILDTGKTLLEIKKILLDKGANSVSLAVLLDKPTGRKYDIYADYIGGIVPNEFVVGYGLDYNEYYRNLPFIGVLKEDIYRK